MSEAAGAVATGAQSPAPMTNGATNGAAKAAPPQKSDGKIADAKIPLDAKRLPDAKTEAKAAAERRKYKLKVDGKEQEWEGTDDDIKVALQKSHAAEKRLEQASTLKKQYEAAAEMAKKDPHAALKMVAGLDDAALEAAYEKRLAEKYALEDLQKQNPQAYELEQAKRRLAEFETKERQRVEAEQAKQRAAQVDAQRKEMARRAGEVMDDVGIADETFRRTVLLNMIADVLETEAEYDDVKLTREQITNRVKGNLSTIAKAHIGSAKGADLFNVLKAAGVSFGDLRDALMSQTQRGGQRITPSTQPKRTEPEPSRPRTQEEIMREDRNLHDRAQHARLFGRVR